MTEQEISELKKQLEDAIQRINVTETRMNTLTSLVMMLLDEQDASV